MVFVPERCVAGPTPKDARLPARRAYRSERRTAISVVAASYSWNIRAKWMGIDEMRFEQKKRCILLEALNYKENYFF